MIDKQKYVKVITNPTERTKVSSVDIRNQNITITANGVYTADEGYTGIGTATVNVPTEATLTTKTITVNGIYNASSDSADGYSSVDVAVPNGTESLLATSNGTYTPSGSNIGFNSVEVNVSTPLPTKYGCSIDTFLGNVTESELDFPTGSAQIDFSGITVIKANVLNSKFNRCKGITTVNMSGITTIQASGCSNCFIESSIVSLNLSSLTEVNTLNACNSICYNCKSLTTVNLNSLTTISGSSSFSSAFYGCILLQNTNFLSNLTTISGSNSFSYCFANCTGLTTATFDSLANILDGWSMRNCFQGCTSLTTISFPALSNVGTSTNQFTDMLSSCSNVTVHFPTDMQSVIGSWSSVINGFSGTNTTVLFDL